MQPTGTGGPTIAGRYRLGARLGRGGMADVFDAHDERLDRPVAVKLLRPELSADPGMRARFEREARAAARLNHPNVVAVYDSGEDAGRAYLVMERLPGESLADRMRAGPVDPDWLRGVAGDVLAALGAAHDRGIVHRDVKPGNILLDPEGHAKVGDFGIAKAIRSAAAGDPTDPATADLTAVGMLIGTVAYLAPEQVEGGPASPQSDLYSVGVVLYEALAGRKPYPGGDEPVAQARAVVEGGAPDIAALRPDVPPDLAAVVRRAMDRRPGDRYASAAAMRAALADEGEDTRLLPAAAAGGLAGAAGGAAAGVAGRAARGAAAGAAALAATTVAALPPRPLPPTAPAPRPVPGPDAGGFAGPPGGRPTRGGSGRRRGHRRGRQVLVTSLAALVVAGALAAVALAGHGGGRRQTGRRTVVTTGASTARTTTTTVPPGVAALLAEADALKALDQPGPTQLAYDLEQVATTPAGQRAAEATIYAGRAQQLLTDGLVTAQQYGAALNALEGVGGTAPTTTTTTSTTTTSTTTSTTTAPSTTTTTAASTTTTTGDGPGQGPPGGGPGQGGPGKGGPGKGNGSQDHHNQQVQAGPAGGGPGG